MMKGHGRTWLLGALWLGATMVSPALAEVGISDQEIRIGVVNDQSGSAKSMGQGLMAGSQAYFKKINAAGGVHGRKIRVIAYDDNYDPQKTVQWTKKLIEEDQVFLLLNYVGTPTSTAVRPVVSQAKIPYLFPYTGAEFLRHPVNHLIFNLRASYFDEAEDLVKYLVRQRNINRIGVFVQDDAAGAAGRAGVMRALHLLKLKMAGEGTYKRGTVDVEGAYQILSKERPEAIIMTGTPKPTAAFVKMIQGGDYRPLLLSLSSVGAEALAAEAGAAGEGVLISQVFPATAELSLPAMRQYHADMKAAGQKIFNSNSVEGYFNAVVLVEGLKHAGTNPTHEQFISAMESLHTDLGGLKVTYSNTEHQGLREIFLTKLSRGGQILSVAKQ